MLNAKRRTLKIALQEKHVCWLPAFSVKRSALSIQRKAYLTASLQAVAIKLAPATLGCTPSPVQ